MGTQTVMMGVRVTTMKAMKVMVVLEEARRSTRAEYGC